MHLVRIPDLKYQRPRQIGANVCFCRRSAIARLAVTGVFSADLLERRAHRTAIQRGQLVRAQAPTKMVFPEPSLIVRRGLTFPWQLVSLLNRP